MVVTCRARPVRHGRTVPDLRLTSDGVTEGADMRPTPAYHDHGEAWRLVVTPALAPGVMAHSFRRPTSTSDGVTEGVDTRTDVRG